MPELSPPTRKRYHATLKLVTTMSDHRYDSFVAIGDSFTEGMSDTHPAGGYRGWADLLATRLAETRPRLRYANLAIRGKVVGQIAEDQVPSAASMRADLVSFAGGVNDLMRPRCDLDVVCAAVEGAVGRLVETSGTLILFQPIDPSRRMRGSARLVRRLRHLTALVCELGERHRAVVVDLASARVFDDPRLWADDRIHLNGEGHRRVAEAVGQAIGLPARFDWKAPLPPMRPATLAERRLADARWARGHLLPWIGRRLTGRSSGDGLTPKRPSLAPLDVDISGSGDSR
ncbi:SGNH/GDSL hydrolase family protein [Haloechinothrix salitolerans]